VTPSRGAALKAVLVLLVTVFSAATQAQPAACREGTRPNVAAGDTRCAAPDKERSVPATPASETPKDALGDWVTGDPIHRLLPTAPERMARVRPPELTVG